ncbi:MAG: hypothetical protein ACHQT6_03225 [Candidatus Acidiferrales bacterium]
MTSDLPIKRHHLAVSGTLHEGDYTHNVGDAVPNVRCDQRVDVMDPGGNELSKFLSVQVIHLTGGWLLGATGEGNEQRGAKRGDSGS